MKDPTVAGTDILDGRHANQHIPQFIGYLRVFEQSDERDYYTAAKNFWDMVVPHRIYSHGGVGVGEILRKRDVIAGSLYSEPNNHDHAESCVVYNMLKLSRNLFFHDPDPKYMNYYEQGLFNQILASRRDTDSVTSPEVTYFIPVRPGERAELRQRRHVLRRHRDGEPHEVPGLDLLPLGGRRRRSTSISTSRRCSTGARRDSRSSRRRAIRSRAPAPSPCAATGGWQ